MAEQEKNPEFAGRSDQEIPKEEEKKSGVGEKFKKALRQEEWRDSELAKLKKSLQEKYGGKLPEGELEKFLESEKVQEAMEQNSKDLADWEEKKKTLYGPFDVNKIKESSQNLWGEIKNLFKRKK
jgi:hypothetical protein